MKEIRKKICLLLVFLSVFFTLAAAKSIKKSLNISLKEKRVQDLDFTGLSLVFYLNITNSSSKPMYLSSYDYRLVVNGKEYLRLKTALENNIKIDAKENTLISLPMKITYDLLFQAVKGIEKEDKALCYIAGGLTFSERRKKTERLPFVFSGEFPILKKPEIEFLALQVKDLTIGGADLIFKIKLKNRNGFELLVDRLIYKLSLENKAVGQGQIWDDKNIEKKGEKVFSLPFLINFFEVGKEVFNILHQPSALCQFFGEADVTTSWGRIKILFDKREKITISKVF